ncbi:MAG: protein translocase subunit SecF [Rickettsiales bacterium]|jgi:preprotein translocase SecF subunit|nr:protein translocase subunit SecF [Rickettsiales bacterium]
MATQFKFMKYGRLAYMVYGALILISVASLLVRSLNFGIDFTGGILMEVAPKSGLVHMDEMRTRLSDWKPELQSISGTNAVMIRVGLDNATDEAQNAKVAEIKKSLGDEYEYRQVQVVGPRIGDELIMSGLLAVLFSLIGMAVYIWIRYAGGYAVGAFLSLFVEFFLMFGFFSITGLEFNQVAIVVILMGLGYSVNDKVVNYDRVQENAVKYRKMPNDELIDLSVNEMLRRTLMTSISTALAMVAMAVWGGETLRGFALAMLFSIALGTATSIWISNSLLRNFDIRKQV